MAPRSFEGALLAYPGASWEDAEKACKHLICPDNRCLVPQHETVP